jgi:hypothetical protein
MPEVPQHPARQRLGRPRVVAPAHAGGFQVAPELPDPDSGLLRAITLTAIEAVRSGEMTVEQAVVYAAVPSWMEGHIEVWW